MQKIVLSDILPEIFAGSSLQSDVWQTDVEFDKGRKYLVQADSGKGKSSLFGYVYGYRSDFEGKIFFDTTDIVAIDDKHWDSIRKHSLSILFQDLKIFPELTAWENIQLKNKLTHHKSDSDIRRLLNRLEIADKADKLCEKLSWGQQRRVAIVRAVCQRRTHQPYRRQNGSRCCRHHYRRGRQAKGGCRSVFYRQIPSTAI